MPTVPSGGPTSVRETVVQSTSYRVEWGPVECHSQNGIITSYTLTVDGSYYRKHFHINGDSDGGVYVIDGLNQSATYSIEVSASTVAGMGSYSERLMFTTPDSKYFVCIIVQRTNHFAL